MSVSTGAVERRRPGDVHTVLARSILVDGFDLVLDLERSHGSWLVDARDGTEYLDLFTFFASSALGMNHPALADDAAFRAELCAAALNKPSATPTSTRCEMARFVDTFDRVLGDPGLPHLFFVDGGALAVENALKVAFDWKSRWNEAHGLDPALGTRVLHLREAFHGRQRVHDVADEHRSRQDRPLTRCSPGRGSTTPYVRAAIPVAEQRERERPRSRRRRRPSPRTRTTSPASIVEPIQGEGGDHHFRPEFLQRLQRSVRRPRRAVRRRRGADRLRADRHRVGLPAARADPGRRRVRQEDAGLRRDGRRAGRRGARQRLRRQLADQLDVGRRAHRHGAGPAHPGGRRGRRADRERRRAGRLPADGLHDSPASCPTPSATCAAGD